jgi:hypothetical protein
MGYDRDELRALLVQVRALGAWLRPVIWRPVAPRPAQLRPGPRHSTHNSLFPMITHCQNYFDNALQLICTLKANPLATLGPANLAASRTRTTQARPHHAKEDEAYAAHSYSNHTHDGANHDSRHDDHSPLSDQDLGCLHKSSRQEL